jgi:hypothetical protein
MRWRHEASTAYGFVNLGAWLRQLAVAAGQARLGTPFARRKLVEPPKPKEFNSRKCGCGPGASVMKALIGQILSVAIVGGVIYLVWLLLRWLTH